MSDEREADFNQRQRLPAETGEKSMCCGDDFSIDLEKWTLPPMAAHPGMGLPEFDLTAAGNELISGKMTD